MPRTMQLTSNHIDEVCGTDVLVHLQGLPPYWTFEFGGGSTHWWTVPTQIVSEDQNSISLHPYKLGGKNKPWDCINAIIAWHYWYDQVLYLYYYYYWTYTWKSMALLKCPSLSKSCHKKNNHCFIVDLSILEMEVLSTFAQHQYLSCFLYNSKPCYYTMYLKKRYPPFHHALSKMTPQCFNSLCQNTRVIVMCMWEQAIMHPGEIPNGFISTRP